MNYAVYKNGKIIKAGTRTFRNRDAEESFTRKMKEKYTTKAGDLVDVWYR